MKQCEGTDCTYKFEPKTANQRYADNSCRKTLDKDGICRVRRESRGPLWPVVNQGPAIRLPKPRTVAKKTAKYKKCVVVPDAQIGFTEVVMGSWSRLMMKKQLRLCLQSFVM